jgi:hypothetical protein
MVALLLRVFFFALLASKVFFVMRARLHFLTSQVSNSRKLHDGSVSCVHVHANKSFFKNSKLCVSAEDMTILQNVSFQHRTNIEVGLNIF